MPELHSGDFCGQRFQLIHFKIKKTINDFINSIDTKLYSRIRASKGDAECRRYLKEHLQKQLTIHSVVVPKGTFTAEQVLTELNKCKDLMDARLHFECEDL